MFVVPTVEHHLGMTSIDIHWNHRWCSQSYGKPMGWWFSIAIYWRVICQLGNENLNFWPSFNWWCHRRPDVRPRLSEIHVFGQLRFLQLNGRNGFRGTMGYPYLIYLTFFFSIHKNYPHHCHCHFFYPYYHYKSIFNKILI